MEICENTIDIVSFDFDNNSDNFMFFDPSNRSDSEMSSNSPCLPQQRLLSTQIDESPRQNKKESSGNSNTSPIENSSLPKTNNGKKPCK